MAVLNLRNVPDELAAYLKSEAALVRMGYHEYCVGILACAMEVAKKNGESGFWPVYSLDSRNVPIGLVPSSDPIKKIAGILVRGKGAESGNYHQAPNGDLVDAEGTVVGSWLSSEKSRLEKTEGGGTPDLSPVGKAQDGEILAGLDISIGSEPAIFYGRSGIAPDFNEVFIPKINRGESVSAQDQKIHLLADALAKNSDGSVFSPKRLEEAKELAKTDIRFAKALHADGVELDLEIITRWKLMGTSVDNLAAMLDRWAEKEGSDWINICRHALADADEIAGISQEAAVVFHSRGVPLSREILVRWGLAENYKPKMESVDGTRDYSEGRGKEDKDRGVDGGNPAALPESHDGGQSGAVATGKPKVNMEALRDICAGNIPGGTLVLSPDPHEVDLCGFKSYNEIDGEYYVCGKEVHGPKVKHGEWIKV